MYLGSLSDVADVAIIFDLTFAINVRGDGWLADSFATTPKMSLYLFAFAVTDFKKLDAESFNGYQVNFLPLGLSELS